MRFARGAVALMLCGFALPVMADTVNLDFTGNSSPSQTKVFGTGWSQATAFGYQSSFLEPMDHWFPKLVKVTQSNSGLGVQGVFGGSANAIDRRTVFQEYLQIDFDKPVILDGATFGSLESNADHGVKILVVDPVYQTILKTQDITSLLKGPAQTVNFAGGLQGSRFIFTAGNVTSLVDLLGNAKFSLEGLSVSTIEPSQGPVPAAVPLPAAGIGGIVLLGLLGAGRFYARRSSGL